MDLMDLLISTNEEWSDDRAAFLTRKIKDGQIKTIKTSRMSAGKTCSPFKAEMTALKSDLE